MADVEIKYNNSIIASLSGSGSEILDTNGTLCEDDITIEYTKPIYAGLNNVEYKVTVKLTSPIDPQYSDGIYQLYSATKLEFDSQDVEYLGNITSPTGSCSVVITKERPFLIVYSFNSNPTVYLGYIYMNGVDIDSSDDVKLDYAYASVDVSKFGGGTLVLDSIPYA